MARKKKLAKVHLSEKDRDFLVQVDETAFDLGKVASISVLTKGYSWKLAKQFEVDGESVQVYLYGRENSTNAATLTITSQVATDNPHRVAHLKGHFNAVVALFENAQLEIDKVDKPSIKGEIPSVIRYGVSGKKLDGSPLVVKGITVFAYKRTYLFQAIADKNETASQLIAVSETLIEKQEKAPTRNP